MSDLNNTPNVTEKLPADAPLDRPHRRGSIGQARGIVQEWWWMRLTSLLLVPVCLWFILELIGHLLGAEPMNLVVWLSSPLVAFTLVVLLGVGFLHARLGLHEIVVDYVHAPAAKRAANVAVDLFTLGLAVGSIAAIVHLYLKA